MGFKHKRVFYTSRLEDDHKEFEGQQEEMRE